MTRLEGKRKNSWCVSDCSELTWGKRKGKGKKVSDNKSKCEALPSSLTCWAMQTTWREKDLT